jgi:hypothetical protein
MERCRARARPLGQPLSQQHRHATHARQTVKLVVLMLPVRLQHEPSRLESTLLTHCK